jgi:hypothetical protein
MKPCIDEALTNAYAEGRKDEAEETKDAAAELRKAMGVSQDFSDWPIATLMAKAAERIRADMQRQSEAVQVVGDKLARQ